MKKIYPIAVVSLRLIWELVGVSIIAYEDGIHEVGAGILFLLPWLFVFGVFGFLPLTIIAIKSTKKIEYITSDIILTIPLMGILPFKETFGTIIYDVVFVSIAVLFLVILGIAKIIQYISVKFHKN